MSDTDIENESNIQSVLFLFQKSVLKIKKKYVIL